MLNNCWHRYLCISSKTVSLSSFWLITACFFSLFSSCPKFPLFLFLAYISLCLVLFSSGSFLSPPTLFTCHSTHFAFWLSHQVFWGQEHLNCLNLVEEHLRAYLHLEKGDLANSSSKSKPLHTQPPPSPGSLSPQTEHSSDDLRTGHFQYIQDSGDCSHSAWWSHPETTCRIYSRL